MPKKLDNWLDEIGFDYWSIAKRFSFAHAIDLMMLRDKIFRNRRKYILTYHRITNNKSHLSGPNQSLFISKKSFELQIKHLVRKYKIVSLDQLVKNINNRQPVIAITFDDGFKDIFLNAYPILQKYRVPATIFLTTDYINQKKVYWWDKIALILTKKGLKKVKVRNIPRKISKQIIEISSIIDVKKKNLTIKKFINALKKFNPEDRENLIKDLSKQLGISKSDFLKDNAMLNWAEARSMQESGLISFGSHTKTHRILTLLDRVQQKKELLDSKKIIEEQLKSKIFFIAYPNGDNNKQINKIAKEAGYTAGFVTDKFISEENDIFSLKRIPVVEKE